MTANTIFLTILSPPGCGTTNVSTISNTAHRLLIHGLLQGPAVQRLPLNHFYEPALWLRQKSTGGALRHAFFRSPYSDLTFMFHAKYTRLRSHRSFTAGDL